MKWGLKKDIDNLLLLDDIRLFKLIEIVYYSLISFIITVILGNVLENDDYMPYFFVTYDYEKEDIYTLFKDILLDITAIVIILYYVKKILRCIPFIFAPLNKKYKPSMKGEVDVGIVVGMGLVLYTSLITIKDKIKAFDVKIKEKMDNFINVPPDNPFTVVPLRENVASNFKF